MVLLYWARVLTCPAWTKGLNISGRDFQTPKHCMRSLKKQLFIKLLFLGQVLLPFHFKIFLSYSDIFLFHLLISWYQAFNSVLSMQRNYSNAFIILPYTHTDTHTNIWLSATHGGAQGLLMVVFWDIVVPKTEPAA